MPIGSRRKRGGDEYVFIDGKAMLSSEAIRVDLTAEDTAAVPGQAEAATVPGAKEAGKSGKASGVGKKWSLKKSFDELNSGSAWDMNDDYGITMQQVLNLQQDDKRATRVRLGILLALLVVLTLGSLCLSGTEIGVWRDPITVIKAFGTWVYLTFGKIFGLSYYDVLAPNRAAQEIDGYAAIISRFSTTFGTLICGLLLALAGMMYQNVFRNPLASPSYLGVSAGVRLGTIVLVLMFGELAVDMQGVRYVYCYIGGIAILLGVILFAKLMAGKHGKINIADMLIAGTIFSQLLQVFSQFILSYVLTDDQYEVFYELTSGMRSSFEWYANVLLVLIFLISVVPVFLARFRLNTVAFDDSEARLLGVNPQTTRVFVLIAGTIMILAAQIHVGVISIVSLVVPFIVRYIVGSEFGKQLIGNLIFGPLLLIVCQDISGMIPFLDTGMPITTVVAFVALPLYIWMTALGKKGWE